MVNFCFGFNTDIVLCLISITAMAGPGTLIRVTIQYLTKEIYEYTLIPSLLPNLFGCFIMGFHEGFSKSRSDKYVKTGIATGLAGSITTFSSFNFEINSMIITYNPRFGHYFLAIAATFIGGIILYFLGEIISLAMFTKQVQQEILHPNQAINNHANNDQNNIIETDNDDDDGDDDQEIELQEMTNDIDDEQETNETDSLKMVKLRQPKSNHLNGYEINKKKDNQDTLKNNTWHLEHDYCIVIEWTVVFCVMYAICIPCSFLINDILWEAIIMSPFGALLRWYLGKVFNVNNITQIPLGTFIANVFGSLLFTILYVLSGEKDDILFRYYDSIFSGLLTGFCGCLTTISSFVHEKFKLKRNAAIESKTKLKQEVLTCEHEFLTYKISIIYFFLTLIISQILSSIVNAIDIFVL